MSYQGSITVGVEPRHGKLLRLPMSQLSSRAPCWSSPFLPESYNKGSSSDVLHITNFCLWTLSSHRRMGVQGNQVQYLLDECTTVLLLFHVEPKGKMREREKMNSWWHIWDTERPRDIFWMTSSFTWSLCSVSIAHVKGRRTSRGLNLGLAMKSQEAKLSPGKGKSQHAKALTTLADS